MKQMATSSTRRKIFVILVVMLVMCFMLELTEYGVLSTLYHVGMTNYHSFIAYHYINTILHGPGCPDIGEGMTRGKWKTRPLIPSEEKAVDSFLETIRTGHGMPKSMQRKDGKCGNVSYSRWFRAICNPKGETPCCYDGKCVNKTIADCKCSKCFDLRSQIHAEYAKWESDDPRCGVRNFTIEEACRLLQGVKITVVGDSLMRQLYTGLLVVLSNNDFDKIWDRKFPKENRNNCTGMHMFGERLCRWSMRKFATFCHGNTSISLVYKYKIAHKVAFLSQVKARLNKTKTFVLVGVGTHDSFNKSIYKEFMLPAIETIKNNSCVWPKLIWTTNHYFGILKTHKVPQQGNVKVKEFNNFMVEKLRQHNIPILDTFNLTHGVMSPDGAHFGLGVNVMKAQMFLNILQQMKDRGQW